MIFRSCEIALRLPRKRPSSFQPENVIEAAECPRLACCNRP